MKVSHLGKGIVSVARKNGNTTDLHLHPKEFGVTHMTGSSFKSHTANFANAPIKSSPIHKVLNVKDKASGTSMTHHEINAKHAAIAGAGAFAYRGARARNKHPRNAGY